MIEINGRQLCENCFESVTGTVCAACGFDSSDSAPDPSMLMPGSVLQNRYVIGRVVGKGGFGITYLAYDALVCKKIAVKEYFPYGIAQRTAGSTEVSITSADRAEAFKLGAEKFYNEAKLVARFNGNPNIVGVYDCFYENNTVYMAMEYLRGCTLKEYIREHGILTAPQGIFVAKSIAGALVVAHSALVLHRDISPDNIILCDDGNIKLIDFGAARQVVAEYSQSFSVILKPGFAPPEQYRKKGNQGPWTDVYALGTTLYFMLTGDIPEDPSGRFDDDDTFKENLFDIDSGLWELITKATKLNINERYPDAYELKKAIDLVGIKAEPLIVSDGSFNEGTEPEFVSSGNVTDMNVSIKTFQPKQSFWRKHRRTFIEITCGLLVAAIIIPLAVKVYTLSGIESTFNPNGSIQSAAFGDSINLDKEGFNKPLYSCLIDNDKALYSVIYDGLRSSKESIEIPSSVCNVSMVADIFDDVMNDNPTLNYIQGYTVDYVDNNGNKEPDPNEAVYSIIPNYTDTDPAEVDDYIARTLSETDLDDNDPIEFLRVIHDKLISETDLVARNSSPTSSTTHGALIEHKADDLGIARAICDYAQRLGYFSFVADTHFTNVMDVAIIRIKIDGKWYNINFLVNSSYNESNITKIPVAEDGRISHIWFTISDFYQNSSGIFTYVRNFGEKYSPVFPTPDGVTISDGEVVAPKVNYYLEDHLNEQFYYSVTADSIYSIVLEKAKETIESGEDTFYLYMLPSDVDELWNLMKKSFILNLKREYNITISGFTGEFSGDRIILTMQK